MNFAPIVLLGFAVATPVVNHGSGEPSIARGITAAAPAAQAAERPATPQHTGVHALLAGLAADVRRLPSMPNVAIAVAGGGVALAVHPFDATFNVRLRSHYDTFNAIFAPGKYVGNTPEQMGLALVTYLVGRLSDRPKVSHLGMDLLRAQIITEGLTEAIKLSVGRERPDRSNRQSFPSGHASVTFASATVIERHVGWRRSLLAYGVATYVAASRLHDNRHYLSDVAFGAAVGAIGGHTIVAGHGGGVWTIAPAQVPGGGAVVMVRRFE